MDVGSDGAIIAALWGVLRNDATMQQLFGKPPPIHLDWAKQDSPFPYIVHTLETEGEAPWAVRSGRYVLDVWDYAEQATRVLAIQSRITQLLDALWIPVDDGAAAVRLRLRRWRPIASDTEYIWRRSSEWSVRFLATKEMHGVLERGS